MTRRLLFSSCRKIVEEPCGRVPLRSGSVRLHVRPARRLSKHQISQATSLFWIWVKSLSFLHRERIRNRKRNSIWNLKYIYVCVRCSSIFCLVSVTYIPFYVDTILLFLWALVTSVMPSDKLLKLWDITYVYKRRELSGGSRVCFKVLISPPCSLPALVWRQNFRARGPHPNRTSTRGGCSFSRDGAPLLATHTTTIKYRHVRGVTVKNLPFQLSWSRFCSFSRQEL